MSKFFHWLGDNMLNIILVVWLLSIGVILSIGMGNEASQRQQVISEHPQCILLDKSSHDDYYYMVCDGNVVIVKPNS